MINGICCLYIIVTKVYFSVQEKEKESNEDPVKMLFDLYCDEKEKNVDALALKYIIEDFWTKGLCQVCLPKSNRLFYSSFFYPKKY